MEGLKNPPRPYRWGKFQGIVLVLMGLAGLFLGAVRDWPILALEATFVGTGFCLFWKMRAGVVLLIYLCASVVWHLIFDGGHPQITLVMISFFATPCMFYYPKRWKELSWSRVNRRKQTKHIGPSEQVKLLPDLGKHLAALGTLQNTMLIYLTWDMETLQIVGPGRYCTTRVQPLKDILYCATFDFGADILIELMRNAPLDTLNLVTGELDSDEVSARTILLPTPISVGVGAILGDSQRGLHDLFIPLIIVEVITGKAESAALLGTL